MGEVSDPRLASLSARSLPGTLLWAGHQSRVIELFIPSLLRAETVLRTEKDLMVVLGTVMIAALLSENMWIELSLVILQKNLQMEEMAWRSAWNMVVILPSEIDSSRSRSDPLKIAKPAPDNLFFWPICQRNQYRSLQRGYLTPSLGHWIYPL